MAQVLIKDFLLVQNWRRVESYLSAFLSLFSDPSFGFVYLLPFPPASSELSWLHFSEISVSLQNHHAVLSAPDLIVFPTQYLASAVAAQLTVGRCEQTRFDKISRAYQSLPLHIKTCQHNAQNKSTFFQARPLKCLYS